VNAESYFKNVKCFKLNISTLFPQHIHHELEIFWVTNVPGHHRKIVPIQQQLTEKLQRLPPRHIVIRVQQLLIVLKKLVVIGFKETGDQCLMSIEKISKCQEGIGGDVERRKLNVFKKFIKLFGVQYQFC
jgi:hypothetical protein